MYCYIVIEEMGQVKKPKYEDVILRNTILNNRVYEFKEEIWEILKDISNTHKEFVNGRNYLSASWNDDCSVLTFVYPFQKFIRYRIVETQLALDL